MVLNTFWQGSVSVRRVPLLFLGIFSDPRKSSIMPLVSSKVKTDDEFQLRKAENAIQPEDNKKE